MRIECDNEAVVSVVRYRKIRDKVLCAYARNISMLPALFDTQNCKSYNFQVQSIQQQTCYQDGKVHLQTRRFCDQQIQTPQWVHVTLHMLHID